MSLFTDLKEVFTAYAQRIKGLAAADVEIKDDLDALDSKVDNVITGTDVINPKYPYGAIVDDNGHVIAGMPETYNGRELTSTGLINPKYPGGAICDEAGNVLLGVPSFNHDPEIGTVYDYNIYGKRISILGDSISTYEGMIPSGYAIYYPKGDVDDPSKTWWMKVIKATGAILGTNASWSGSRVSGDLTTDTTAKPGCGNQRITDLASNGVPDIIFCYISTNDWGGGVEIGHFGPTDPMPEDGNITTIAYAYALMLYKIRTTYPNAVVFCMTSALGRQSSADEDQQHPWLNARGETLHQLNHEISEIAHMFGCKVIDLETCGIHPWNVANYMVDSKLHPNSAGTTLISKAVLKEIKKWYGR